MNLIFFFAVRTIRELSIRRAQFKELLSANRNMTSGRYFRLMVLAGVEVMFTVPLGAFSIYLNASGAPVNRWVSWANTHYDFSRVEQIPSVVWHQNQLTVAGIELTRYVVVFCAFVFFALFGFADEARRNYRLAYTSFAKKVGLSTGTDSSATWSGTGFVVLFWLRASFTYSRPIRLIRSKPDASYHCGSGDMPVFITQRTERKRDSMASFSTSLSVGEFGSFDVTQEKQPYLPNSSMGTISKDMIPCPYADITLPTLPQLTLDVNAVPPHTPDAPHSRRSSIDV